MTDSQQGPAETGRRTRLRRLVTTWSPVRHAVDAAGALLVLLAFLVTADAVLRKLFNFPISGAFELSQLTVLAVIATGIASTSATDSHIRIELLTSRLPSLPTRLADLLNSVLGMLIFAMLTYYCATRGYEDWLAGSYWPGNINIPTVFAWSTLTVAALFSMTSFARSIFIPADREGYFMSDEGN